MCCTNRICFRAKVRLTGFLAVMQSKVRPPTAAPHSTTHRREAECTRRQAGKICTIFNVRQSNFSEVALLALSAPHRPIPDCHAHQFGRATHCLALQPFVVTFHHHCLHCTASLACSRSRCKRDKGQFTNTRVQGRRAESRLDLPFLSLLSQNGV